MPRIAKQEEEKNIISASGERVQDLLEFKCFPKKFASMEMVNSILGTSRRIHVCHSSARLILKNFYLLVMQTEDISTLFSVSCSDNTYLQHIAIGTEQVKDRITVMFPRGESIYHDN